MSEDELEKALDDRIQNQLSHMYLDRAALDFFKKLSIGTISAVILLGFSAWDWKSRADEAIKTMKETQYTKGDGALIEQTVRTNHDLILAIKQQVERNSESTYRIEKSLDVFIGSHREERGRTGR